MENEAICDSAPDIRVKPYLSFSIERILAKGPISRQPDPGDKEPLLKDSASSRGSDQAAKPLKSFFNRLPWLAYTRYCPPKIPSKFGSSHRAREQSLYNFIVFSSGVKWITF